MTDHATAGVGGRRVRHRRHARPVAAAVALLGTLSALAGCTTGPSPTAGPSPSPGADPADVTQAFLTAVDDGDFATALSLSTSSASDFACPGMTQDGQESGLAGPEVGAVEVDGASATAEVTYWAAGSRWHTETLDLSLGDGAWRVVIPEHFSISLTFDAPTIAEVVIDDTCTVPVVDAAVDVVAWPDLYLVHTQDPSGVFTEREDEFFLAVPAGGDDAPVVLPAVPELAFATILGPASIQLGDAMEACFESGYTDASCPSGVAGADAPTGEFFRVLTGDFMLIDRVWTDDGATWRFETGTGLASVSFGGVPTEVAFTTTGTLSTDPSGELVVAIDAP